MQLSHCVIGSGRGMITCTNHMTRRRRLILGILIPIGAIGMAVIVAYFVVLPWIVRREVRSVFAQAGLSNVHFDLRNSSLWSTNLANIAAGENDLLKIGAVAIRYSPLDAIGGKLESIRIENARIVLDLDDLPALGSATAPATSPTSRPAQSIALPFERVELESSVLALVRRGHSVELPVTGTLIVQRGLHRADLKLTSALAAAPLNVIGTLDLASGAGELSADVSQADAAMVLELLPADVRRTLEMAGGRLSSSLALARDAKSHLTASLSITADDVWLAAAEQIGAEAHDVNGTIAFEELIKLVTAPRQTIRIGRFKVSDQDFSNAIISFQLRGPRTFEIDRLEMDWAGGHIAFDPLTLHPQQLSIDTAVRVDRVALAPLVALLTQGRATGTGTVSGTVPFRVTFANADERAGGADAVQIDFVDGLLRADSPGSLLLGASSESFAKAVEASMAQMGTSRDIEQVRKDVIESMQDFGYKTLAARFYKLDGEDVIGIRIEGRGNTGQRVPMNLNFNLQNVDAGVRSYLNTWRSVLSDVMGKAESQ